LKERIKKILFLAAALCVASHAVARAPHVLRVAYQVDPATFDPDNAFLLSGLDVWRAVYEQLVTYAPGTMTLSPGLASDWSVSPDRLTYTFHLRNNVHFHDGSLLTAQSVVASLKRRANGNFALSYFLAGARDISAPDPLTLTIKLSTPDPSFLHRLASPWGPKIIGPDALDNHPPAWLDAHADGTGPYTLAAVRPGQRITLLRNDKFAGKLPYFEKIEIFIIPEIGQQVLLLQSGELDAVLHGYPFDRLATLHSDLAVDAYQDLSIEMGYVNFARALHAPDVREAVFAALAPAIWLKEAFGPYATPATSLYPVAMRLPTPPPRPTVDISQARRVIAAHAPVAIEIGYAAEEASTQQRAVELMVASLRAIGVSATSRPFPLGQGFTLRNALDFAPDIWIAQNTPDADDPATMAEPFFMTDAPLNMLGYADAQSDRLIQAAGHAAEPATRRDLYMQVDRRLIAQGAFLPIATVMDVIVHRRDLAGITNTPVFPWTLDYEFLGRAAP
jgi:peptide/nickel transport system substrate-binding protein